MISIKQLGYRFKDANKDALSGVDLDIAEGEFVGIIGSAGSGKSMLTYACNGIIPHYYQGDFFGSVLIDGKDTVECSLMDISRIVGSVCQDIDSQMVASIVEDEILYGLENFGYSKEEIKERMDFALESLHVSDLRHREIATLSGGQKQKVALAAIIALKPRILVLDEPTAALDPVSSRGIFELLRKLCDEQGITIILVEQKIMLLSEFADRLVVMNEGKVAIDGSVEEVLAHADELECLGVNCPRVVTLSRAMGKLGLGDGRVCRTVGQAAELVEEVQASELVEEVYA